MIASRRGVFHGRLNIHIRLCIYILFCIYIYILCRRILDVYKSQPLLSRLVAGVAGSLERAGCRCGEEIAEQGNSGVVRDDTSVIGCDELPCDKRYIYIWISGISCTTEDASQLVRTKNEFVLCHFQKSKIDIVCRMM